MNAPSFELATDIDYLITNETSEKVSANWIRETYSQRNWIEVLKSRNQRMVGFITIPSKK